MDTPAAMIGAASLVLWMCSITVSRSSVLAAQYVLGVWVEPEDNRVNVWLMCRCRCGGLSVMTT